MKNVINTLNDILDKITRKTQITLFQIQILRGPYGPDGMLFK